MHRLAGHNSRSLPTDVGDYATDTYSSGGQSLTPEEFDAIFNPKPPKASGGDVGGDAGGPSTGNESAGADGADAETKKHVAFGKNTAERVAADVLAYTNPYTGTIAFIGEMVEAVNDDDPVAIAVTCISYALSWFGFGGLFARSAVAQATSKVATKVIGTAAVETIAEAGAKVAGAVSKGVNAVEKVVASGVSAGKNAVVNAATKAIGQEGMAVVKTIQKTSANIVRGANKIVAPLRNKVYNPIRNTINKFSTKVQGRIETFQAKNFPNVYRRMYGNTGSRVLGSGVEGEYRSLSTYAADDGIDDIAEHVVEQSTGEVASTSMQAAEEIKSSARQMQTDVSSLNREIAFMKESIDADVAKLQQLRSSNGSVLSVSVKKGKVNANSVVDEVDRLLQGKIRSSDNSAKTLRLLENIGVDVKEIKYADLSNKQNYIRQKFLAKFDEMMSVARNIEARAQAAASRASVGEYVKLTQTEPITTFGHLVNVYDKLQASRGLGSDMRPYSILFVKLTMELVAESLKHQHDQARRQEQVHSSLQSYNGDDYFKNV